MIGRRGARSDEVMNSFSTIHSTSVHQPAGALSTLDPQLKMPRQGRMNGKVAYMLSIVRE